ncbi:MAG: cytochrome c3 family protein [Deltaproteobacteria bacterium]|nr:cytochrome c3 family protein [Deltaproteobacteria bacterium]
MSRVTYLTAHFVILVATIYSLAGCGFSKPKVSNADWMSPRFDHARFSETCATCHESDRPSPVYKTAHGNGLDCVSCHRYTTDKTWGSYLQYSHSPAPKSCTFCHGSMRPAPPHTQEGDCVNCHKFPNWRSEA